MTQEEANRKILEGWSKERLAEEWVREHIKYNELKDQIENLQQENERLKELVDADNESYDIQETIINRQKSELLEQEDYKSRCEKAIEFLNNIDCMDFTPLIKILEGKNE